MIKIELIKNKILQYNKEVEKTYSKIIDQFLAIKDIDKEPIKNLIKEKETLYNKKMLYVKELFTLLAKNEQENKKHKEINKKQLYEFIDNIPIGISHIDKDYTFTFLNKTYKQQIHNENHPIGNALKNIKDDIIGKTIVEVIGEDGFKTTKPAIDQAILGKSTNFYNYQPKLQTYFYHSFFPLYNNQEEIIGIQTASIDITKQKLHEFQKSQTEQFLDNIPLGIVHMDKNYNVTFFNKFFKDRIENKKDPIGKLLYNIKDKIIGKSLIEIIGEKTFNQAKRLIDQALKGEVTSFFDYYPQFNIYSLTKYFPIYDKKNNVVGVQTIDIDITKQKLHEFYKSQTDKFLDNIPIGITHIDKNYRFTFLNKFFREQTKNPKHPIGYALKDIKGKILNKHIKVSIGEESFAALKPSLNKALKGEAISLYDYQPKFNSYYFTKFFPLYNNKEEIIGVQTASIDITEQKLHEFQKFQTDQFLDNIPIAISKYNLDTKLIKANKQYYDTFKNTEHHNNIIGKKAVSLLGNEGIKVVLPYFSKAFTGEIQRLSHYQPKLKSYYFSTFVPNYNEKNEVISVNVACIDITELKNNQKKLESTINELTKTNTELENYNYTVAHDLREPIRAISVIAESLKLKTLNNKKLNSLIEHIEVNTEFMDNLICNLLNYHNIESQIGCQERANIKETLDEIIHNYKHVLEKEINIVEKIDIPIININKLHLRQLLQNIIGNAIKYNDSNIIKLEIKTYIKKNNYVISIKDNGIDIDKKHHKCIFDIKYKVPSTKQKGSGLGLAICKKIIDNYKGKIYVKSHSYGSIFTLHIPKIEKR